MRLSSLLYGPTKPPWKVMFFGTDEFSLHVLQALNENRMSGYSRNSVVETLCVAHPNFKKLSPVNKYADFCGIRQYEWPFSHYNPKGFDVGVLASFGHLIPKRVIDMFPQGIINVHPSLLPRWRGAAPLHHTILQGDKTTGISIMALEPKHFDRGHLLDQMEIPVPSNVTTHHLRDLLGPIGGKLVIEVLSSFPDSLSSAQPQSNQGVTYAHKVTQDMSFIDWNRQTCDEIDRQYRALHPTLKLRSEWEGTVVSLLDMVNVHCLPNLSVESTNPPPGLPVFTKTDDVLWIRCKDGWVGFKNIMIKKKMSAKSFYNGYLSKKHLKGVAFRSITNNLFNESYLNLIRSPKPL